MNLFTQEYIQAIEYLSLTIQKVRSGGRLAEYRSLDSGDGIEFHDYRSYVPGDDIRQIDWNIYRRSGELFLRLFDKTEDLPVYILLDMSQSMFAEKPPRANIAKLLAGILAGVTLNQLNEVSIYSFGSAITSSKARISGKRNLFPVLKFIEDLESAGETHLTKLVQEFNRTKQRSGLAVVISDFFDPNGIEAITGALKQLRHRLLLFPVVRESDHSPDTIGDVKLIDCESHKTIDLTITPERLKQYQEAYRNFFNTLQTLATSRRSLYFPIDADQPLMEQLGHLFVGGTLAV